MQENSYHIILWKKATIELNFLIWASQRKKRAMNKIVNRCANNQDKETERKDVSIVRKMLKMLAKVVFFHIIFQDVENDGLHHSFTGNSVSWYSIFKYLKKKTKKIYWQNSDLQ